MCMIVPRSDDDLGPSASGIIILYRLAVNYCYMTVIVLDDVPLPKLCVGSVDTHAITRYRYKKSEVIIRSQFRLSDIHKTFARSPHLASGCINPESSETEQRRRIFFGDGVEIRVAFIMLVE